VHLATALNQRHNWSFAGKFCAGITYPANKGFIHFNSAGEFFSVTAECKPDAMCHEPSGLVCDF
jgi:hypothetical protein